MPQSPKLNLWLMAATDFKVIGNEADERRMGTKPTKFIICLFSRSWAVLSENSQGHEVWVKIRCMYRGIPCLRCFMKSCVLEKGSQATRDIFSKEYHTENMREALWVNTQGKYHLCFFSSRLPLA